MSDDVKVIRDALAAGVTVGEWKVLDGRRVSVTLQTTEGCGFDSHCVALTHDSMGRLNAEAHAAYIAACSPDRIARLLARLEEAERDAARYRWLREMGRLGFEGAPGWRTVLSFETVDPDAPTLDAAVDAMMKG